MYRSIYQPGKSYLAISEQFFEIIQASVSEGFDVHSTFQNIPLTTLWSMLAGIAHLLAVS